MATFDACVDGGLRYRWPLEQIEGMWQAYDEATPKFAVYSAIAVHEDIYVEDLSRAMLALEA